MVNIAVLISGGGTNLQSLIDACNGGVINGNIKLVISSKANAYGLVRAQNANIETLYTKDQKEILDILKNKEIDLVVLAGYLSIVGDELISEYKNRIINIHPSLLPKYGGKGMYGMKVHQTVIESKDKESGITIHYINKEYDKGTVILQAKCPVMKDDTPETLAERVHQLEYKYYPETIEKLLTH